MKNQFPVFKTSNLLLRRIQDADLQSIFRGLSDPKVVRYYGISYQAIEETYQQMQWYTQLEKSNTGRHWAVCSHQNQTFYGVIGLNNWVKKYRKAEIGLWLLPEFWGKGIMSTCLPLICDYGFNHWNLHRIEAFVESENYNCQKLLKKMMFSYEGTLKDCEIKHGRFISLDIYAKFDK